MKKHSKIVFSLLLALLLSFCCILGGCGDSSHEHTFNTEKWKYDENTHWNPATCGHSKAKGNESAHVFGAGNTCVVCGYEMKDASTHTHTFETDWTYNQTYHWKAAACGHAAKSETAMHAFNGDGVCACGYKSDHAHTYTKGYIYNAASHWHVCDICNVRTEKEDHTMSNGSCSVCGYQVSEPVGSTDNYDTYYEIFVYSYNDTDDNAIGDLKGITQKLDYIHDLGYTGIWLTPIHPSPNNNHMYAVSNYYGVNWKFGQMEDFDELVTEAHKRGIKIILDMVFNHSSSNTIWFQEGRQAFVQGDTTNRYYDYYNFSATPKTGYANYGENQYAEALFNSSMPDLNFDSVALRDELENVMRFWLMDHNVDGFRLDAAKHYYGPSSSPDHVKSAETVKWINDTAKSYKPNAYVVAEVWDSANTIKSYYTRSGSDSFFYFPAAMDASTGKTPRASGDIAQAVSSSNPGTFFNSMLNAYNAAAGHIPAPFMDNHDTNRIASGLGEDKEKIKFAYGLLSMYTGTTFTYYGDEIGMIGQRTSGSTDAERRFAMLWDETVPPQIVVDNFQNLYAFPGAIQQLADAASILNYYKQCNRARNSYPELLRGKPEKISESNGVLVFSKTYNGQTVKVAINFSKSEQTVTVAGASLQMSICATGSVASSGSTLTMPRYSIAILK